MKFSIDRNEEILLTPSSRLDLKGKATVKTKFWKIEIVDKNGEIKPYCEINNDDFTVICGMFNFKKLSKMSKDSANKVALAKYGDRLMSAMNNLKLHIKITNKDVINFINNNDDLILKSKNLSKSIVDLEYVYSAQQASIQENIGF